MKTNQALQFDIKCTTEYLWEELNLRKSLLNGTLSVRDYKLLSPVETGRYDEFKIPKAGHVYVERYGFSPEHALVIVRTLVEGWQNWYIRRLRKACLGREFVVSHFYLTLERAGSFLVNPVGGLVPVYSLDSERFAVITVTGLRKLSDRGYYVLWDGDLIPVDSSTKKYHLGASKEEIEAIKQEVENHCLRFELDALPMYYSSELAVSAVLEQICKVIEER